MTLPRKTPPDATPPDPKLPEATTHGGDAPAIASALGLDPAHLMDLSASLNPFAPDVPALAAQHLDSLVAYPDPEAATECFASALGVDADRLVLTNGGAEAIALVAAHLGSGSIVDPEFSLYRRHLPSVDIDAGRWRSNPSNPLGQLAGADDMAEVWDEAFHPLATGSWTRGDDKAWRLGSLTKLWACAGLRLGYVIAPTARDARIINAAQPRWAVNGLALALLPHLLDLTDLEGWATDIARLRSFCRTELEGVGYKVTESAANWVLLHDVDAPSVRSRLVAHGIVVRDCTSFGLPTTVRLALPRPEHVDRVLSAVAAIVEL